MLYFPNHVQHRAPQTCRVSRHRRLDPTIMAHFRIGTQELLEDLCVPLIVDVAMNAKKMVVLPRVCDWLSIGALGTAVCAIGLGACVRHGAIKSLGDLPFSHSGIRWVWQSMSSIRTFTCELGYPSCLSASGQVVNSSSLSSLRLDRQAWR